jgi:hypothetical protein
MTIGAAVAGEWTCDTVALAGACLTIAAWTIPSRGRVLTWAARWLAFAVFQPLVEGFRPWSCRLGPA